MKQHFLLIVALSYLGALGQNYVPSGGEAAFLNGARVNLNSVSAGANWSTALNPSRGVFSFRSGSGFANGISLLTAVTDNPLAWVKGFVKYYARDLTVANNDFVFPVGSGSSQLFLKVNDVPSGIDLTVSWTDTNPWYSQAKDAPIQSVSQLGRWEWIAAGTPGNLLVTAKLPNTIGGINTSNNNSLRLVGWMPLPAPGKWVNLSGTSGIMGNVLAGTVPNGCTMLGIGNINNVTFKTSSGLMDYADVEGITHFTLYPNPTSGEVTLEFRATRNEIGAIRLYDATGKEVFGQTLALNKGKNTHMLNFPKIAAGTYNLQLIDSGGYTIVKGQQIIIR